MTDLTTWGVRIVAGLLVFAAVFLATKSIRTAYEERALFKQQLAAEQQELAAAKASLTDYQRRVLEANNLAEKRAMASQAIHTVTKEIIREVPVRIPADACPLPPDWRVLHNAAAQGRAPAAAAAPRGADAAGAAAGGAPGK